MKHTGEGHEERLAALCAGVDDARAAVGRSELGTCPACVELIALDAALAADGAEERAALAAVRALPPLPAGRAEAALRERLESATPRARVRSRRGLVLAALAAAALIAVLLWPRAGGGSEPPVKLGTRLELVAPLGTVPDFASFRWQPAADAAWYRVEIESLDPAAGGARSQSERLYEPHYEPGPEERTRWGRNIRWTVVAYRATGANDILDSRSGSARLSSP